jgi:hypothetical protein
MLYRRFQSKKTDVTQAEATCTEKSKEAFRSSREKKLAWKDISATASKQNK